MRVGLLVTVLAIAPTLTAAQQLPAGFPKYEINQRCAAWAPTEDARKVCLSENQAGYDAARAVWSDLSDQTKATCTGLVARADRPGAPLPTPYASLADCVFQFLDTDLTRKQPPFEY